MWWRKKKSSPDLEFAFKAEGKKYYRIPAQMALPIERFGKLQENLMWQSAGMTAQELTGLIEIGEKNWQEYIKGNEKAMSRVGLVFEEMRMRSQMVMHTELLYHFLGILYIREDENPEVYDEEIQLEKVQAFKELVKKKGAWSTFQIPELQRVNQQLNWSQAEWEELWKASLREQERLKRVIEFLKSGVISAREKKTSTTN